MSDENLNKIFHTLGKIEASQEAMRTDIESIKEDTADYKKTKNRIIGACVVISTSIGGGVSVILNKLGIPV